VNEVWKQPSVSFEAYRQMVGQEMGVSSWHLIDQKRIDLYADVIDDRQFIHVDPERAKKTAFGTTVAHGFLTMSLLSVMSYEVIPPVAGVTMRVNYGFDRLRFISPVKSGSRVRGRFTLTEATLRKPGELLSRTAVSVEIDGEIVVSSSEALAFESVPERLVVIGAGYIGLELGSVWSRLGAKVTVLEYLDRILPGMDLETAKDALKVFKRQGLTFELGARVTAVKIAGKGAKRTATVSVDGGAAIEADRVLVAVGRKPNTAGLGLEEAGVDLDERGRVVVDANFATSAAGVYAIGDLVAGPMLAHKASEDGVALIESFKGVAPRVDYNLVPGVVYTEPEIGTVGATEEQLKEQGVPYRKGSFPFSANGRARALGHTDGRVKILAHEQTDRILGVHVIGPRAGELVAEAVLAMTFGASSEDVARTIFAHPTLSEAVKEAALAVEGHALHM